MWDDENMIVDGINRKVELKKLTLDGRKFVMMMMVMLMMISSIALFQFYQAMFSETFYLDPSCTTSYFRNLMSYIFE